MARRGHLSQEEGVLLKRVDWWLVHLSRGVKAVFLQNSRPVTCLRGCRSGPRVDLTFSTFHSKSEKVYYYKIPKRRGCHKSTKSTNKIGRLQTSYRDARMYLSSFNGLSYGPVKRLVTSSLDNTLTNHQFYTRIEATNTFPPFLCVLENVSLTPLSTANRLHTSAASSHSVQQRVRQILKAQYHELISNKSPIFPLL